MYLKALNNGLIVSGVDLLCINNLPTAVSVSCQSLIHPVNYLPTEAQNIIDLPIVGKPIEAQNIIDSPIVVEAIEAQNNIDLPIVVEPVERQNIIDLTDEVKTKFG